jgi:acyl-CoA synthetase (AMP-forming)/AMP-acid ligase II
MTSIIPVSRDANPFTLDGTSAWAGGGRMYEGLPDTLIDLLRARVAEEPATEAVAEIGGGRVTYQELWDRAARVAGGLRAVGVGKGDRVAVRYPAGLDWVLAFFGTVMAGGIAAAVNIRLAPPELAVVLDDTKPAVDLAPGTPLPDGDPYVNDSLSSSDIAAFFYTSGTTSGPKAVPTTHRAFLVNAENMTRGLRIRRAGADLRTLISVPLFHVTGCNSQLLTAIYHGGSSVILPALDVAGLISAIKDERISFLVTVPAVYALMLRHSAFAGADISGVRWIGYGGAPIAPALVAVLQQAFPSAAVANGYGMTESASLLTVLPHEDAVDHADSVGYAVPSVDLGIRPLGEDPAVGELVAKGPNVLSAYWNRPDESARALADGWLHTGDVVRVDGAGRIHIIDRVKDMINRGGENVSSVEVEAVLLSAPGVADAAVIAVPDPVMGEKVGAVLVPTGDLDLATVIAFCGERLADFKVPQYVSVSADPLPRNAGGKLLKARLRQTVEWGTPLRLSLTKGATPWTSPSTPGPPSCARPCSTSWPLTSTRPSRCSMSSSASWRTGGHGIRSRCWRSCAPRPASGACGTCSCRASTGPA